MIKKLFKFFCTMVFLFSIVFIIGIFGGIEMGEPIKNLLYIPCVLVITFITYQFIK